jgi:hypothetical protein
MIGDGMNIALFMSNVTLSVVSVRASNNIASGERQTHLCILCITWLSVCSLV